MHGSEIIRPKIELWKQDDADPCVLVTGHQGNVVSALQAVLDRGFAVMQFAPEATKKFRQYANRAVDSYDCLPAIVLMNLHKIYQDLVGPLLEKLNPDAVRRAESRGDPWEAIQAMVDISDAVITQHGTNYEVGRFSWHHCGLGLSPEEFPVDTKNYQLPAQYHNGRIIIPISTAV